MTRLKRGEIIARPPLRRRTGEDRDIAATIIVEVLDTPITLYVPVLVEGYLAVERIDRRVDETLPAFDPHLVCRVMSRHNFLERSWPRHGDLTFRSAPVVPG